MQITIREAQPSDAQQLITYIQRLSDEPDINIPLAPGEFNLIVEEERDILADYSAADNSIFLVAEAGSQIIGAVNLEGGKRRATRHAVILGMSVSKEWRNQGIGNALMGRAIEWAKNTRIVTRIELVVYARNEAAIHLYKKFGFEVEGRRRRIICQYGKYLDDLVMALLL